MKKIIISKLFLYRYRFIIGYSILGLAFVGLLFFMPTIAQTGLSEAEMESATASYHLGKDDIKSGNLLDLPYHLLQKISILLFGLTPYAIKLPSILVGLTLGLILILLLNRWFKNNVSLLTSCLVVLSTPFLFLAGSGTPLIMLVFWPTLLLWLGSKIQGEKHPKPLYSFFFALAMLGAIFTPYMLYFAIICTVFVLSQPHLRFVLKSLPKFLLGLIILIMLAGVIGFGFSISQHPEVIQQLLFMSEASLGSFLGNLFTGLALVFSWHNSLESVFLSPLISLPIFALALIGLFSTTKSFFASRNSIATILLIFCLFLTGLGPDNVIFVIIPFSILVAHGLKYLLEKWYGLFPENPYARVSAVFPLAILFGLIVVPGLLQYIYGYRYNPNVADEFNYDLQIIRKHLTNEKLLVYDHYDFYKILESSTDLQVVDALNSTEPHIAVLGKMPSTEHYEIDRIITSPMRENSDIIYLYTYTETKGD